MSMQFSVNRDKKTTLIIFLFVKIIASDSYEWLACPVSCQ